MIKTLFLFIISCISTMPASSQTASPVATDSAALFMRNYSCLKSIGDASRSSESCVFITVKGTASFCEFCADVSKAGERLILATVWRHAGEQEFMYIVRENGVPYVYDSRRYTAEQRKIAFAFYGELCKMSAQH